jgi:putative FmdB family regulatory protein
MAYYDFSCAKCRKRFTVQQSFEDRGRNVRPKCPKCGSRRVQQMISVAFVKTSKKS